MKDLVELQGELMRLSYHLETLAQTVEELKPKDHSREENYAAIQRLAQESPIVNDCLKDLSEGKQTTYLRLLCTAAGLDGELTTPQLIYLCRLAMGSGCPADPKTFSVMAYQTEYLDWQAAAIDLKGSTLPLLLDMLLAVHCGERKPERGLAFVAELASLLGCDEDDLTVCAQLASALLTASFDSFRAIQAKRCYPQLSYAVPAKWLEKTSVRCGKPYQKVRAVPVTTKKKLIVAPWRFLTEEKSVSMKAKEIAKFGTFAKKGTVLVRFEVDKASLPESDEPYDPPQASPIQAKQAGFIRYIINKDRTREAWVVSAFHPL